MTGDGLTRLLEAATPGPWVVQKEPPWIAGHTYYEDARLIALAPDMAQLLIDMADELRKHSSENEHDYVSHAKADALLARFADLDKQANG